MTVKEAFWSILRLKELKNAKKLTTGPFGLVVEHFCNFLAFFQYFGFQLRLTNGPNPG
jgi:hypothetical protein